MDPQSTHPPRWADAWLLTLLPLRDRDTVSGDLMEEYREKIRPRRSQLAADAWYLGQVGRFAWPIDAVACAFVYWNWRSPELIAAINASGGLQEAFTLPITMIVPGTIIGSIGAWGASMRMRRKPA